MIQKWGLGYAGRHCRFHFACVSNAHCSLAQIMGTELFSTEAAFRNALTLPLPLGESERLSVVDLSSLRGPNKKDAANVLGMALAERGVVLIRLTLDTFPLWDPCELAPLLTGWAFQHVFGRIFASRALCNYFRKPALEGAETGFYSFPLNSLHGGIRGKRIRESHAGLPRSLIWSHSATENPVVDEFIDAQATLRSFITLYREITHVVIEALTTYLADHEGLFRAFVGEQTHHRANHLKLIHSRGASVLEDLKQDPQTAMVCRHRAHVDHCILTLNPPSNSISTSGGAFYYLSTRVRRWCWRPLVVPSFHVAIFGGVDLSTFTDGTPHHLRGLVHQVLATQPQAVNSRSSASYRVTVDPDAFHLCALGGHPFLFHDIPTPTGPEYYQALFRHRQGAKYV